MSFSELNSVVSSAKRNENIFVHFEGSFIYVRKSIGPRIEPGALYVFSSWSLRYFYRY
jgi:hypothetical protein